MNRSEAPGRHLMIPQFNCAWAAQHTLSQEQQKLQCLWHRLKAGIVAASSVCGKDTLAVLACAALTHCQQLLMCNMLSKRLTCFLLLCCCAVCSLLSNSTLISRYAALRATALGLPRADQLYGDSLTLQPLPAAAGGDDPGGGSTVNGSGSFYEAVSSLELRLSGAMGVEVGGRLIL